MRAFSNILTLLILNILTAICCLPIFTAGAALSALHYLVMKMIDGDDGHLFRRYFHEFKVNFKTSTPMWLMLLAIAAFLYFDYRVFLSRNDSPLRVLLVPIFIAMLLLAAFFVWVFPLLARFTNRFAATCHNTWILVFGQAWRTLLMIALWFLITFALSQSWKLLPLYFLFGLSLPAYFNALLYYPVLKKLMNKESGEETNEQEEDGI